MMAEAEISFTDQDAYAVLTGAKTCTTWLQRKGCKGDTFRVTYAPMNITKTYRITRVLVTCLGDVAANHYRAEGFNSKDAFMRCWRELHPEPHMDYTYLRVYAHFFREA